MLNTSSGFNLIKMSGAGNDFVLLDFFTKDQTQSFLKFISCSSLAEAAVKLCNRHHSVGADGAVFLFKPNKSEQTFRWEFYNADGSRAEMCGNAARCAVSLASIKGWGTGALSFESDVGPVFGEMLEDKQVSVQLSAIGKVRVAQEVILGEKQFKCDFVLSGVPHAVVRVKGDLRSKENLELARGLRNCQAFAPDGANVTFIKSVSDNSLEAVTYERGVEDFTQACGTGAIAAAVSFVGSTWNDQVIHVTMPGGKLAVKLTDKGPELIGPAKYIGNFDLVEV